MTHALGNAAAELNKKQRSSSASKLIMLMLAPSVS